MDRTVQVKVPEQVWGRLASIADNTGTTISEILSDELTGIIGNLLNLEPKKTYNTDREKVIAHYQLLENNARPYKKLRARNPKKYQEKIVDLVKQGYTDKEISQMVGEPMGYIATRRRKAGIFRQP